MTEHLRVAWPDAALFGPRHGRALRLLAVSDESDGSLDSAATRAGLEPIDLVVGCGDLEPDYLCFLADAFQSPLVYVRGNHDIGPAWQADREPGRGAERGVELPSPLTDGAVRRTAGLRIVGFSGAPRYGGRSLEVSSPSMWLRVLVAWWRLRGRPVLVVSHAAPRGLNDAPDVAHRGFVAFRWLLDRLRPPLWLHGHTRLTRRDPAARTALHRGSLVYNCTGATLIELLPPTAVVEPPA